MKPLIFEFAETPLSEQSNSSLVRYSKELNLSVVAGTMIPAISSVNSGTETFTKAGGEGSDADRDILSRRILMATTTETKASRESSDSDSDIRSIQTMMATKTITESREESDSDK